MKRVIRVFSVLLVISFVVSLMTVFVSADETALITTRSEFEKALNSAKDGDTLLVGDIDFNLTGEGAVNEAERLSIGKSITVKNGKNGENAVFLGASFLLNGTNVSGSESDFRFIGITFDEGLDADAITHTDWQLSYYGDGGLISNTPLKCQYAVECTGNTNATFTNCEFKNYMSPSGAAIQAWYLDGDNSHCRLNITLDGCSFERNSALNAGGAIYLRGKDNVTLSAVHCRFSDNRSGFDQQSVGGGAVALYDCDSEFKNCVFTENVGNHFYGGDRFFDFGYVPEMGGNFILYDDTLSGGAVFAQGGDLSMQSCTLRDNAASYGGAIALTTMTADIEDCVIVNNKAVSVLDDEHKNKYLGVGSCNGIGGAIYIDGAKHITIGNTEIAENYADSAYGAIYSTYVTFDSEFYEKFSLELMFCTIRNNTCGVAISEIQNDSGTWLYDTHAIPYIDTFGCLVIDSIYEADIPRSENPTEENSFNYYGSFAHEDWYENGHLLHASVISTDFVKEKLGDRNYYGVFTVGANNHDATYNFFMDGECRESATVPSGELPPLPTFEKTGHTLTHWTLDEDEFQQDSPLVVGNATESVDLYAVFVPNTYTVTFDFGFTKTEVEQIHGTALSLPDAPGMDGHKFIGWFTLAAGEGERLLDGMSFTSCEDVTYFAYYQKISPIIGIVIISVLVLIVAVCAVWLILTRKKNEAPAIAEVPLTDNLTGDADVTTPRIIKTRYTDEEIEKIIHATEETHLLTNRELEVFRELLKGKKQSEIGYYLGISISTVKDNAGRIYGKLGVANKDELFNKIDSKLRKS